jgi:hypothetical protein
VTSGLYLTAVGPQGILTVRSKAVTKDELFAFDPNHAQVSLQSAFNGRLVSVKQGLDVSANQVELAHTETFQLEEDPLNQKWLIRTNTNKYWCVSGTPSASIVQHQPPQQTPIQSSMRTMNNDNGRSLFDIVWIRPGYVALRTQCDGSTRMEPKYVSCSATGNMRACANDCNSEQELFRLHLVNRPILVLKCEYGLVGYKNKTSYKLECNKVCTY